MKLTFLPLYLAISLVPVLFVACAWWSNRQQAAAASRSRRKTQESNKARDLPTNTPRKESKENPSRRSRWAGGPLIRARRGAINLKGAAGNVRFVGGGGGNNNNNEPSDIEMQSLYTLADEEKKTTAAASPWPIVVHTEEIAMPTQPSPTRMRPRHNTQQETWTSNNEARRAPSMKPSTWNGNKDRYGRPTSTPTESAPSRHWWELPDDDDDDDGDNDDTNGKPHSDPKPFQFRLRGAPTDQRRRHAH